MARRVIDCAKTGETFVFDDDWNDAAGRVRQMEYELAPRGKVDSHFHPSTAQFFRVVSGTLHVRVAGQMSVLTAGQEARTGVGDVHAQWNEGPDVARVVEGYEPPLDIEPFFTVLPHALASRNVLKVAVFIADHRAVVRVKSIPLRVLAFTCAPLGRLCGLSRWYATLLPSSPAAA